jgi:hypothetical protein
MCNLPTRKSKQGDSDITSSNNDIFPTLHFLHVYEDRSNAMQLHESVRDSGASIHHPYEPLLSTFVNVVPSMF